MPYRNSLPLPISPIHYFAEETAHSLSCGLNLRVCRQRLYRRLGGVHLHSRLVRRGLALSAVALGNFLTPEGLSAAVPPELFDSTLHTALEVAGGAAVAEAARPGVSELIQTSVGLVVLEESPRWVATAGVLVLLLLIGSCAAWTASPSWTRSQPAGPGSGPAAEVAGPAPVAPEDAALLGTADGTSKFLQGGCHAK